MAIFNTDLDYTQLIQFTGGTLQLGSFVQIRNALTQRMKDLYGNDIDVSPSSADGQYINSLALIFNNIMQTLKKANDSLDPAVATGQYLDTLCSYNNVFRIEPTASSASIYVRNESGAPIRTNKLTFVDKNNVLWVWDNGGVEIEIPIPADEHESFPLAGVLCDELGNVSAPGANAFYQYDGLDQEGKEIWTPTGSDNPNSQTWNRPSLYTSSLTGTIFQCVEHNGLYVWQYADAEAGNDRETDEALRSRRYQMLGNSSVTVLEGLKGNLLGLDIIKEAFVFSNVATGDGSVSLSSPEFEPIADGCSLRAHSVYVALRYKEGAEGNDEIVAKTIYDKLTPGIGTSPYKTLQSLKYEKITEEPKDWSRNFSRYCLATLNSSDNVWKKNTFYQQQYVSGVYYYTLLTEKPSSWDSTYMSYYKVSYNASSSFPGGGVLVPTESKMFEIVRTRDFSDFVYWKMCLPQKPLFTIKFTTNPKIYDYPSTYSSHSPASGIEIRIFEALKKAFDEAKIDEYLSASVLLTAMQQADQQKNGMPTFFVESGYFEGDTTMSIFPANLNYVSRAVEGGYHFEYTVSSGLPTGEAILTIA